ncbi:oxidoreductase [Streptomyces sp. NP160]|uniref:aldo/keto reductase n=1 Tax=Streptomyces sp. NP160 TaxID=2586637 RepID=UPI00111AB75F|nr:aldo/keto reductase [Streptomyces sp. NP160]TNM67113.1 oxidoreductase [Streptomyces sp. NP160]
MPDADVFRWAVLGPGSIARRFVRELPASPTGVLVAVGSSDPARARALADEAEAGGEQGAARGGRVTSGTYEEVLADPSVDGVYIAVVHPRHAELAVAAARAGKHLLVEKPLTPDRGSAAGVVDAARQAGVALLEAFAYRFHPATRRLLELVAAGAVGEVSHIDSSFCFASSPNPAGDPRGPGRLFDPATAGGGILDVGCYPVSFARAVAGAARGRAFADPLPGPEGVRAVGHLGPTGVDEWALAHLDFGGGLLATVRTGVRLEEPQTAVVRGSLGTLELHDPWTVQAAPRLVLRRVGEEPVEQTWDGAAPAQQAFALEAEALAAAARALAAGTGTGEAPEQTHEDSLGTLAVLDRWRAGTGLLYPFEAETASIPTLSRQPLRVPEPGTASIPVGTVPGLASPVSRLVMGCDNQPTLSHASALFDAFVEAGGTTFDTAWIYGRDGDYERRFGRWLANRGIREQVTVIVKGAHTPHCDPESLSRQLLESFERQGLERADLYLMHRDDPSVPVGEFVDVLDEHARAGRIGVYGGSNWTPERFDEANAYAQTHGRAGFGVLSNHFGLARALDVPWAGCVHATDPASRAWLEERQVPLLPWSSQARGFFARDDAEMRGDAELVRCYLSEDNLERKRRAQHLGERLGVPTTAVALAYVLAQRFPTFALIGPRSLAELRSSLEGLAVELTAEQVAWLDLREA